MQKISFLGMGAMGSRMAASLLGAGYEVTVWDRFAHAALPLVEKGARFAASPREAARGADLVFVMVWDDAASRFVWLDPDVGALDGMSPGSVAIECATLTKSWMEQLYDACKSRNIDFVDAPMSGSLPHAENKELVFVVGAEEHVLARVKPVLLAMGEKVNHAGAPTLGIATKLLINTMLGVQVAMMSELIAFMRRAGMDAERVVAMMSTTPVLSPRLHREAKFMLAGNFDTRVRVSQMVKDIGYAIEHAREHEAQVPLAEAARSLFMKAASKGWEESDFTVLAELYQRDEMR